MPLHPQAQTYLAQIALTSRPAWHETPLAESRQTFASLTVIFGEGPEMHSVEDLSTDDGIPIRIYHPTDARDQPVVMYFHGGGFVIGDLETHDSTCKRIAAASGYPVVAVDYRLAPEHKYPAALDDCLAATQWVADHGAERHMDTQRILVAGDSAGGNLAAAVTMRVRDEQRSISIVGQVLIYPVIEPNFYTESYQAFAVDHGLTLETMQWFWKQYLYGTEADPQYAMLHCELNGLPPAHVVTAEYDVLRDEGEAYAASLQSAGVATTVKRYDGMLHGFVHSAGVFDDGKRAAHDIAAVMHAMCE